MISGAITSVGYDRESSTLEIEFREGSVYRYFDVPEFLHQGMMLASSKGQFFNTRLNNRYRWEAVLDAAASEVELR